MRSPTAAPPPPAAALMLLALLQLHPPFDALLLTPPRHPLLVHCSHRCTPCHSSNSVRMSVAPSPQRRNLCTSGAAATSAAAAFIAGALGGAEPSSGFGEPKPTKPLRVCLVNAVNARESAELLRRDLQEGKRIAESRGAVKAVVVGLDLKSCLLQGSNYLGSGARREEAQTHALEAVFYLASVVEFDAFDKLKKEYTSTVALQSMTPEKVDFIQQALQAAVRELDAYLVLFTEDDRAEARDLYRRYYMPVQQQLALQAQEEAAAAARRAGGR